MSETYLAIWNSTVNETFETNAERFLLSRRLCTGTWKKTQHAVVLEHATIDQAGEEALRLTDQSLLQDTSLFVPSYFGPVLAKFRWRYNQSYHPNKSNPFSPEAPLQKTANSLAASIVWARLISWIENNNVTLGHAQWKDTDDIHTVHSVVTLKRDRLLMLVLLVHPILTVVATVWKVTLWKTPIGDDFGLISLLAGIAETKAGPLYGASLSGTVKRRVRVGFHIVRGLGQGARQHEHIVAHFDSQKPTDALSRGQKYA